MNPRTRKIYLDDIASAPVEFLGDPYERDDGEVHISFDGSYSELQSFLEFEYDYHAVARYSEPDVFILLLPGTPLVE